MHVHFGATGTVPLRLAELFFTDEGLWIVEYGTFTPLFGLASGGPARAPPPIARAIAGEGERGGRARGGR
ncbi:MAG: hypothetical protein V5A23_04005, partial [Halobacteriales archaeon]